MRIDISDNLRHFFVRYNEERRLSLWQALLDELVSIKVQAQFVESDEQLNAVKHKFKGICRYLAIEFDMQMAQIISAEQLLDVVGHIYEQVVAIKDEL